MTDQIAYGGRIIFIMILSILYLGAWAITIDTLMHSDRRSIEDNLFTKIWLKGHAILVVLFFIWCFVHNI